MRRPSRQELNGVSGDWMHINSISLLGPNRWFDGGDERFHPDNIIWSGRSTNIIAIIDKKTGKIVWQIGPDYASTQALRNLGQIIGPHHPHLVPKGLPGEGNIMLFDNGGWAGYGTPNPASLNGLDNARRDYSRVIEFNPNTLEIVWQYTPREAGYVIPVNAFNFYSPLVSCAQRLLNGNTVITEGVCQRIFEVTRDHEPVWEYINPYVNPLRFRSGIPVPGVDDLVYRSYRVPYDWVPQVGKPDEIALKAVDRTKYRVPGSPRGVVGKTTRVNTRNKIAPTTAQFCVVPEAKPEK